MTLYEFTLLGEDDQKRVIWDGTYLGVRVEDNNLVQLYSLGDFYIEVFYSQSINKIVSVRPFRSTKLLEPYLKQIEINQP